MNQAKLRTEHAPKQVHDRTEKTDIHLLLRRSELAQFYLQTRLNLLQMQDLHTELPEFLITLKQQFPLQVMPEYCLVLCYPFSQEFFMFHTLEKTLASRDLRLLQEQLLPRSVEISFEQMGTIRFAGHECQMLFQGLSFAVWRVYLNYSAEQAPEPEILQELDEQIGQGFAQKAQQLENIQNILQQERRDFSAELHDSIAQIIGFLRLKSAQLNQQCHQDIIYNPLLEQTEEIASYTHYAYQQVRELITASRLTYQELDFPTALKKIIGEFEHQSSIAFELDNRVPQLKISAKQSVQLLYIIRESLSNIVRHAHASKALISLRQSQQQLHIQIDDDGRGIQEGLKRQDSFGMEIMRERTERIGAVLSVEANKPKGTAVKLILEI